MVIDLVYPSNAVLQLVSQDKMPALMQNRPIFNLFPLRSVDAGLYMWEQQANYLGLQNVRGYNGSPVNIKKVGLNRYQLPIGVYGEFEEILEDEIVLRRQYGTFANTIDITTLVGYAQDRLLQRRLDRIELIGWTVLATGSFSVSGPQGSVLHTDGYTTQTFSAAVTWATAATATPLADFRSVQLLHRGHSSWFDANATAYMNRGTFNNLISNSNNADLYGRRVQGLSIINNVTDLNRLLMNDDLPSVVVYDEGYLDDTGTFQLFIPNNKVVVIGRRPAGQTIGEYIFIRNANNPGMASGPYMQVIDRAGMQIPRTVEVHDGHSGGPALYFSSAVVSMSV